MTATGACPHARLGCRAGDADLSIQRAEKKTMKFKDLFVPRCLHSDPNVRLNFVKNSNDAKLLRQMSEKDDDENVRKAAAERAEELMAGQRQPA